MISLKLVEDNFKLNVIVINKYYGSLIWLIDRNHTLQIQSRILHLEDTIRYNMAFFNYRLRRNQWNRIGFIGDKFITFIHRK